MSLKQNSSKKFGLYSFQALTLTFLFLVASCSSPFFKKRIVADDGERSAYSVWADLQQSGTDFAARAVVVGDGLTNEGLLGGVTFGGEKEASSALITRVMGPKTETFKTFVEAQPEDVQKKFYIDFLSNYMKNANGYRTYKDNNGITIDLARDVKDLEGNPKTIDIERMRLDDYENASFDQLKEKFNAFLDQTDGKPYAFMKPTVRSKLFKGQLDLPKPAFNSYSSNSGSMSYREYVPHFGLPEKYVDNAHGHGGGQGGGWEINFKPLGTYGEFEEMIVWFRTELKNVGKLFQAPGHQRIVFRNHPELKTNHLAEMYRSIQALIVLEGINGNTGIESSSYKNVHNDASFKNVDAQDLGRGVIRPEGSKWSPDTRAVEFRAGTKDLRLSRFYQTSFAARVATNDFSGMVDINDYDLVPGTTSRYGGGSTTPVTSGDLINRFGVSQEVAEKTIANINQSGNKLEYIVPFWKWESEGNPYVGPAKREFLKSTTKDFIEKVAALDGSSEVMKKQIRSILRGWTKSSRLAEDLRNYIRPKNSTVSTTDALRYEPRGGSFGANQVDVNNIDLGIEYSGKFPLKLTADFSEDKLEDNRKAWLQTYVDLTDEERVEVIRKISTDLSNALGGDAPVEVVDADDHGHGLDIAFELRDEQNRKWRVEWDGIGRSYTPEGDVIDGSARGGSVELVTPKFNPTADEIETIYKVFNDNNIMPDLKAGGGHVNIDLAAFDGKPKQLARFLSIFNEHRGIIALMFQDYYRMKAGEPIDISSRLASELRDFNGSEDDLKKLLYNEKYFNTRFGRKTRYVQFDLSAYFQDVIPEEFLTDDFDISKPTEPWRRQFRVDPRIRKGEFRLFNAPRDPFESALQIKLVRAMMHKALNEDDALSGRVQDVDHVKYLKNAGSADADLEKLCNELGLDINEYRTVMAEGLSDMDLKTKSVFFETHESRVGYFKKQPGWGNAVEPRAEPINSAGREWTPGPADAQNTMTNEDKIAAARRAEQMRANIAPDRQVPDALQRSGDCVSLLSALN